ncbi:PREDICTED: uncharacterized protein LOC107186806 [Dufourea novaeangliae]|uniref:Uncharacterized protein n=1 Tax=Dufourea novaeangliae TaxID=178035 RepID=A0A154P9X3_DUFNO|nr:PREDICTED: uncharacterized protein LOC107186806 [Dufourea novaeangliae]KZC08627.1 hypothetical protein WN55_11211 [Dufourea novaeangliae]
MRITVSVVLFLGLALYVQSEPIPGNKEEDDQSALDCVWEDNTMGCLRTRLARDIDRIEMQVTGKKSETPMSAVIEQAGNFMAEVVDDIQNPDKAEQVEEEPEADEKVEGRRKKFGKKKKQLQKLLGLAMLFKAKLSLLLQLVSTHLQVKFFVIAVITLILNAARFWLDIKKSHPAKVIYYEHAQHQHHYDHDDHEHSGGGGYWGRSSNDSPQDLAYSAYAAKN